MRRCLFFFLLCLSLQAAPVTVTETALVINNKAVPFLFGAEVQYFRARGGPGRNVPRAKVLAAWHKLLDRVKEAEMNTVIFYIPWDFHEPVEGTFDFEGKLDQDRDGNADYPSRDLKTFLSLLKERGLKNIMVRPGPYINAEWGPEGFGAVPKWFLDHYPQALAKTLSPGKPRVASFPHPQYRQRVERWFRALVPFLKPYLGKEVTFLQIDNETNFFWDSLYERDWHPEVLARYRAFLRDQYSDDPARLSKAYGSPITFETVKAPQAITDKTYPGASWHYDWFHFHDLEIDDYYRFLRTTWERLKVREPEILFTSCDSFNAPKDGLLPRLDYRQRNRLSLTTMNIYPKTLGSQAESTMNTPMKAAHDAALVAAAHKQFYGAASQWVMSSETVGGWFPPVEVSLATRQHTYGSLIGGGVKAIIIYYFHEGWNWNGLEKEDSELKFDAPLDINFEPRPAFELLKSLGRTLRSGLGDVAMEASPHNAPLLIARDSRGQYPVSADKDLLKIVSTDSASLYGFLREAGYPAEIGFVDHMTDGELGRYRAIIWDDPGYASKEFTARLEKFSQEGGIVLRLPRTFVGWNEDGYLKIPDAAERLESVRKLLQRHGLEPLVSASAPFVHAWARRGKGRSLVFVENFSRKPQEVRVAIQGVAGRWQRLWGGPAAQAKGSSPRLPIGADRIDIWLVD